VRSELAKEHCQTGGGGLAFLDGNVAKCFWQFWVKSVELLGFWLVCGVVSPASLDLRGGEFRVCGGKVAIQHCQVGGRAGVGNVDWQGCQEECHGREFAADGHGWPRVRGRK